MKKILLTGINGFVGRNLVISLENKYEIYGLDIASNKNKSIRETYMWKEFDKIPHIDSIIHLAGKAHDLKNISNDKEYFNINLGLTKKIFDYFMKSSATKFIFFSSVKAVADKVEGILTEDNIPNPLTAYGKSKLEAEKYISNNKLPNNKKVYILRPCMIHGLGNKGNLNLLYKFVHKGIPYPLSAYKNQRSLLSIDNLSFIINDLLQKDISSGVYNVCDNEPLSTEEIVKIIGKGIDKKVKLLIIHKKVVKTLAELGDFFNLPLNTERLNKLTENYIVSNKKILKELEIENLPVSSKNGLLKTIKSFNKSNH